jgi:endoglucanase
MLNKKLFCVAFFGFWCVFTGVTHAACVAQGTSLLSMRGTALAKGVNLSGWLQDIHAPMPNLGALQHLKNIGLTHVRVPLNGSLLMERFASPGKSKIIWERLDHTLKVLTGMGYAIMLDMHPDASFAQLHKQKPEDALRELKKLWSVLVKRYSDYSGDTLFFELLNEPVVADGLWREQADRLVNFLRPLSPDSSFIVGPSGGQRIDDLIKWVPLADPNVVYAVHYYDPMVFTHQGLDWERDNPIRLLKGIPFPVDLSDTRMQDLLGKLRTSEQGNYAEQLEKGLINPWDENNVRQDFDKLMEWRSVHGRAVMVNEFGVLKAVAPSDSRYYWLGLVRREAERICAGWTHWELDQGFGLTDHEGRSDETIIQRLMD